MPGVQAVCCQFEKTSELRQRLRSTKASFHRLPDPPRLRSLPPREAAAARLSLDPDAPHAGHYRRSLGAQTINEAAVRMLSGMTLSGWQVLHLAGPRARRRGPRRLSRGEFAARVIDFTAAMADVWAVADLAISRSGASSCAELTACGVPSVLLPYPFHRDMHQRLNAPGAGRRRGGGPDG